MKKIFLILTALFMSAMTMAEEKTLTFDLTSNPGGWPTTNPTTLTNYTYTLDGVDYTFGLKKARYNNNGYLQLTQPTALGLPAIEGYRLTNVVAKNSSHCATDVYVGISVSSETENYISGGETQNWATRNSSYTYELNETSNNTVYYLYVTSSNAQVTEITLTYERSFPFTVTLDSIVIKGAATKMAYEVGEAFDPAGLEVWGLYTKYVKNDSTSKITSGITWSINPETFTTVSGNASVTLSASYTDKTSSDTTITGINVSNPVPFSYLAPVYNTVGDPTSGILRWDTLQCTNYTLVEDTTTSLTEGWYVVTDTLQIGSLPCTGDVHLILADGAQLTTTGGAAAITVSSTGTSLTIYAQSTDPAQMGTLKANGGMNAAAIGGGFLGSGSGITINGGRVTATGGVTAAGIGGGYQGSGSNITINGGIVTATGGGGGAGIGGGYFSSGTNITINGGTVTATGGSDATGIGGGFYGNGSNIIINGGTVTATGYENASGIGGGVSGSASNIFVATNLIVKADNTNPPTTVITNTGADLASSLNGSRYATVKNAWTEWEVFAPAGSNNATWTLSAWLDGTSSVETYVRTSTTDTTKKQIKCVGWGVGTYSQDGVDILLDWNTTDDSIRISMQSTGYYVSSYSDNAVLGTYRTGYYDRAQGLFSFYMCYSVPQYYTQGQGFGMGNETLQMAGNFYTEWEAFTPAGSNNATWTLSAWQNGTTSVETYVRTSIIDTTKKQIKCAGWGAGLFTQDGVDIVLDWNTTDDSIRIPMQSTGYYVSTYSDNAVLGTFKTGYYNRAQGTFYFYVGYSVPQYYVQAQGFGFGDETLQMAGNFYNDSLMTYLSPVYNTEGNLASGILRWDTLQCTNYTLVEDTTTTLNAGWYVVTGTDVQTGTLTCNGAVNLILADGAKLTATSGTDDNAGITVSGDGNSLTVYAQSTDPAQMGTLFATGGVLGAGIGGGVEGSGSNITINGGSVSANGGDLAAGIGGGGFGGSGSNITINGGLVTANGGAAGIGGGGFGGTGSNITINGGSVTANGGESAAGIGGGSEGGGYDITINDGSVTANGGNLAAGIGGGLYNNGSNITINGGTVTANGGYDATGIGGAGGGGTGSNITMATTLIVKADDNNPPTTVITNDGTDLANSLLGKQYVTIEPAPAVSNNLTDIINSELIGKNSGDTVVLNLSNTIDYVISQPVDLGLVNIIINGNGAKVTLADSTQIAGQQLIEINNVNFDCAANTKLAPIALSAAPDSAVHASKGNFYGNTQNVYVDTCAIVLNGCNFSQLPTSLVSNNRAAWILGGLTVNKCVVQFSKSNTKPYIDFESAPNNVGAIKNFTINASTLFNNSIDDAYFIRFANASNGQASKAFPADPHEYITFTNNTFVNICTKKNFGNNTMNNAAYVDEIKGNVFFNVYRLNKYFQTNNTYNFTVADNAINGNIVTIDGTDKSKIATEDTALVLTLPTGAFDFNVEALAAYFTPSATSYAGQNSFGDPRWLTGFTITANVNDTAMGSVTGAGKYAVGSTATLTANAKEGYRFSNWTNANGGTVSTANPWTLTVAGDTTVTANFVPLSVEVQEEVDVPAFAYDYALGYTGASSTFDTSMVYGAINCYAKKAIVYGYNPTTDDYIPRAMSTYDGFFSAAGVPTAYNSTSTPFCIKFYNDGTFWYCTQPDVAEYGAHYTCSWILVNPTTGDAVQYNFSMNDITRTANITANVNNTAMGSVSGSGTYNIGSQATLTATPAAHYHFVNWSNGSTVNPLTITVEKDSSLTANFAIDQYAVATFVNNATMGEVTAGGTYDYGTQITLTATPAAHYHFVNWSNGSTSNPLTVTVEKDSSLTANFAIDTHTVTLVANDATFGTVEGAGTYDYGTQVTAIAVPAAHYHFVNWSNGETNDTIVIDLAGDTTLTANFAIDTHLVTLAVDDVSHGTVEGAGFYDYGTQAIISATADPCYHFVGWDDGVTDNPRIIVVESDTSFTAIFELNVYESEFNEVACDSYTWDEDTYTLSGDYQHRYATINGCDSTATLHLVVNYSNSGEFSEQAAFSYIWDGREYTESGNYTFVYQNVYDCDSTVTLHLIVTSFELPVIDQLNKKAVMLSHYPNGDGEYVDYIDYRWYRDGELVAEGFDNFWEPSVLNGCYHVEVPVDETKTQWVLSNELCFQNGVLVGIDEAEAAIFSFSVAPNPVVKGSMMTVTTQLPEQQLQGASLMMFDLNGRIVTTMPMSQQSVTLPAQQTSGVYVIQITTRSGEKYLQKVVVR